MFLDPRGDEPENWTPQTWMVEHRQKIQKVHNLVAHQINLMSLVPKRQLQELPLPAGDRILLTEKTARWYGKLQWRWERPSYMVVHQPNLTIPFYVVKPEDAQRPLWIVHHNLLIPCVFVARSHEVEREVEAEPAPIVAKDDRSVTPTSHRSGSHWTAQKSGFPKWKRDRSPTLPLPVVQCRPITCVTLM